MCAGNVELSGSFKRTFIAAVAENPTTAPATELPTTTTTTTTTTRNVSTIPRRTTVPTPATFTNLKYWWNRERATRPPLPYQFQRSSFSFSFIVKPNMAPSCHMVVYYMRGQEVVADNADIDVVGEFNNKVRIVRSVSSLVHLHIHSFIFEISSEVSIWL